MLEDALAALLLRFAVGVVALFGGLAAAFAVLGFAAWAHERIQRRRHLRAAERLFMQGGPRP